MIFKETFAKKLIPILIFISYCCCVLPLFFSSRDGVIILPMILVLFPFSLIYFMSQRKIYTMSDIYNILLLLIIVISPYMYISELLSHGGDKGYIFIGFPLLQLGFLLPLVIVRMIDSIRVKKQKPIS